MPIDQVLYTISFVASLIFPCGFVAGVLAGKLSPMPFIPLAMVLMAYPLWALATTWKGQRQAPEDLYKELEEPGEDLREDGRILVKQPNGDSYLLEEMGSDEPIFLEDCTTILRDIKRGGAVELETKAVTVAAFIKLGWMSNFNSAEMIGQILEDGLHTPITQTLWTKITDGLNQAHLITKEHRKKIQVHHSARGLLLYVLPKPMLAGFRSWNR